MTWLLRVAAFLAVVFFLRWLWRWFWTVGWMRLFGITVRGEGPPAPYRGTMKRDPVCGTYVDVAVAVRESAGGETLYFCSQNCLNAYRAQHSYQVPKTG